MAAAPDTVAPPLAYKGRVLRGFSLGMAGAVLAQGGTLLTTVLLARILGKHTFGQWGAVHNTLMTFFQAAASGLGIASTHYVAALRHREPGKLQGLLGFFNVGAVATGGLASLVLAALSSPIAWHLFGSSELSLPLRLASATVLFLVLNAVQSGVLLGFEAFRSLFALQAVQAAALLALAPVLAYTHGLTGVAVALPLAGALTFTWGRFAVRAECRRQGLNGGGLRRSLPMNVIREFLAPTALSGGVSNAAIWTSHALLARQAGGFLQLGQYVAVNQLRNLVLFAPNLLQRAASPVLTSLRSAGGAASCSPALWWNTAVGTGLAVAVALPLLALQSSALGLFGGDYRDAGSLTALMLGSGIVEVYSTMAYLAILSSGRLKYQLFTNVCWAVALIATAQSLTPWLLAKGLATAYLSAWIVSALIYSHLARRLLKAQNSNAERLAADPAARTKTLS